jgi:transposase InsO family protein
MGIYLPRTEDDPYTELEGNPCVKNADRYSFAFETWFLIDLYGAWRQNGRDAVTQKLMENGIEPQKLGKNIPNYIIKRFENGGYPLGRGYDEVKYTESHPLVQSGEYICLPKNSGIEIRPEFKEQLFQQYPDVSLEEGFINAGIDPIDVGYSRMQKLKKEFETRSKELFGSQKNNTTIVEKAPKYREGRDSDVLPDVRSHPYIKEADTVKIQMKDSFYQEANLLLPIGISEIFRIYEIKAEWLTEQDVMLIGCRLMKWDSGQMSADTVPHTEQTLRIWQNREKALTRIVAEGFEKIQQLFTDADIETRRKICRQINEMPRDPWKHYTTQKILERIGLSRSTYYELLNNESYGKGAITRARKEDEDFLLVKQVAEYKGFVKGYRQISMLSEPITGRYISPNRVLNLMRKYGMKTTIRQPSRNRKAMKELLEKNGKANLLLRRFKLHRPNKIRLTDVTYLDYGDDLRAYGSASIDPVTSKLICFVVSENNNLQLALDTLAAMDRYPTVNGGLIHSDQGILYFTDDFQTAVKDRNLIQSMSRRGNCWDNAPQESFFGHFKDESGYRKCKSMEELRRKIEEYSVYYNEERRIWNRGKMTPLEYEEYLTNLDDVSFKAYLSQEEETYLMKKEQSTKKAVEKAKKQKTGRGG